MLIAAFFVIRRALRSTTPTVRESEVSLRKEVRHV